MNPHIEVDMIMIGAMKEADLLQQNFLSSEHILLSILKNKKFRITQLLNDYGMNYHNVREDLIVLNGVLPKNHTLEGYSDIVEDIMILCDNCEAIVMQMMEHETSLANALLQKYAIPIEKIVH